MGKSGEERGRGGALHRDAKCIKLDDFPELLDRRSIVASLLVVGSYSRGRWCHHSHHPIGSKAFLFL